ncbi:MAG: GAF domain-containing protein [Candidatus Eisenbacteria bacterium]|uniref:GAF domain-containing protein n=1 Tax=Eiseniibacteriota bacterium TaxID=2212470 RepID=A0A948S151_UNCEI|nr:GAF domain-containing protein [Candidatus Eisenbacteria bacterium]MBU1947419.1 GAF domain-containing protein [Candidatus Eisenbacteria bacterium]MBU2693392.1 GAF domain-containing protein [Candidatus Eisenbacteria bacterium]
MAAENYKQDLNDLNNILKGERDEIVRMAVIAALIKERHPKCSWVGYYRSLPSGELILGPFQGPVACLRISKGQGVCGAAAGKEQPVLVPDVHAFPGHIACDPRARSELVLPVHDSQGRLRAVLDLDSHAPEAFSTADQDGLLPIARLTYASG